MANEIGILGVQPTGRNRFGGAISLVQVNKVVGYGTAFYPYDVVAQVADGSVEIPATPGTTAPSGVVMSYGAASTATEHLMTPAEGATFMAKEDDSGTLALADRGLNANLVYGAGNATTKRSGHRIAGSTKNTTSTLDVKLHDLAVIPGNAYGAGAVFEITFNRYRGAALVAGV